MQRSRDTKMCKADSSEILSSFEVVLPPSIMETCHRMRPGISTCFLAVNKQEGTSSQITVAKQTDKSIVLRVAVMALGKSRREKKQTDEAVEQQEATEEGPPEEQVREEGELSYQDHCVASTSGMTEKVQPNVRKKPGPAFTKKPGYKKGQGPRPNYNAPSTEASPVAMPLLQKAPATYEGISRASTIVSVKKAKAKAKGENVKGRARYIPTKLKRGPPKLEKNEDPPVITKQPTESRFAKTQATIAAIEAANKKKPTYIGNLGSRRIPEMHVPPPRPRMMPVLQRENNIAEPAFEGQIKTPAGRGKHKRTTQPYGTPRPAGMNKSLTKMWSQKKKRGGRRGGNSRRDSMTPQQDTPSGTTEVYMEDGVSEPFEISGNESTIIITVNDGKIAKPLQKTEILHHKKRWAAANAKTANEEVEDEEESEEEEGVIRFEDEASLDSTADGSPLPRKRRRGPKKPKCRLCSTKFREYIFLFRHVQRKHKTNEGEFYLEEVRALVKYKCPVCNQEFQSEEELEEHTREGCQEPVPFEPLVEPPPLEPPVISPVPKAAPVQPEQQPVAAQASPEAIPASPEGIQSSSEAIQASPEADHASPEADQASPAVDQVSPEADQVFPEAEQASLRQKTLNTKAKIEKNMLAHGEFQHTCEYCKKGFHLRNHLNKHVQVVHEKNKIRKHKCPRCSRQFNLKSNMLQHLQGAHLKRMPYHCPLCQAGFRRMKALTSHVENCKMVDSKPKNKSTIPPPATIEANGS